MKQSYCIPIWAASLAFTACMMLTWSQSSVAQTASDKQSGTPTVLPTPDFKFEGKVGKTYLESSPPEFPQPTKAPAGAPNVVLILLDDSGFESAARLLVNNIESREQ